ncbi:hypothetical protein D7X30_18810 [Corallococcus sp. AB011P]|uniref:hypothetical protein n=1 Tax=unclassified Corallococcus TaxID=2685029 RepID=UPI000EA3DBB9|nr:MULTISPECIES: hypothetical protein [unclassified Corallococcus]RKG57557.1 hypothetical protein D7X30_18810 [Corallococcus sp. AB011P]RKH90106.1 hypothetical protein D7Y21_07895 [Corallococcus sp. AB045]
MRTLVKSLLTASAVLSLVPTAAFALPFQCSYIGCRNVLCEEACYIGLTVETTCGEYTNYMSCGGVPDVSVSTASVTGDEARQAEDASQVCSEEHPAAEQSLTADS